MKEKSKISEKAKTEAEEEKPISNSDMVDIKINDIIPCRWGTGIRDKERFERLKENLKEHGQNTPIKVRPIDDTYEPWAGDHTVKAAKELGWETVKGIIYYNMSDKEAHERCVSDNTTRSNYSSVGLEKEIEFLWNSGDYKSKAELGRKIGFTGAYIGQILKAHKIRQASKVSLDFVSTSTIVNSFPLNGESEKCALLKLVQEGKIQPGEVREVATNLQEKFDVETMNAVLYEDVPYHSIMLKMQEQVNSKVPKKSEKKIPIPAGLNNFPKKSYEFLKDIKEYVYLLHESEKEKAINYVKFSIIVLMDVLVSEEKIDSDVVSSIANQLEIDETLAYNFDGKTTHGINSYI